jgi:hypothetical protein
MGVAATLAARSSSTLLMARKCERMPRILRVYHRRPYENLHNYAALYSRLVGFECECAIGRAAAVGGRGTRDDIDHNTAIADALDAHGGLEQWRSFQKVSAIIVTRRILLMTVSNYKLN